MYRLVSQILLKISSLENKIEFYNKRAYSADQLFADYIFEYVTKPISLPQATIELEVVALQPFRRI